MSGLNFGAKYELVFRFVTQFRIKFLKASLKKRRIRFRNVECRRVKREKKRVKRKQL